MAGIMFHRLNRCANKVSSERLFNPADLITAYLTRCCLATHAGEAATAADL